MARPRPFLTARWLDLGLVTYRIPADLIAARLPSFLEPDRLPGDPPDVAYVSVVAFSFLNTRVRGLAVPMHDDFPEVNLRTYVRPRADRGHDPSRRGVLFFRELVPKPMVTLVANLLYHEHYETVDVSLQTEDSPGRRRLECTIEFGERTHRLVVEGRTPPVSCDEQSREHFFKEHTWGYGVDPEGRPLAYRVQHPAWDVYPVAPADVDVDMHFGELYGHPWDVLDGQDPFHVAYAVGSEIAVYPREVM